MRRHGLHVLDVEVRAHLAVLTQPLTGGRIVHWTTYIGQSVNEIAKILVAAKRQPRASIKAGDRADLPPADSFVQQATFIQKLFALTERKLIN